jgi:hypothetical protein
MAPQRDTVVPSVQVVASSREHGVRITAVAIVVFTVDQAISVIVLSVGALASRIAFHGVSGLAIRRANASVIFTVD